MHTVLIADGRPNRVVRATVFSTDAQVTRNASADIQAGINRIRVELLARHVAADSLLARVFAAGELLGVQYATEPVVESHNREIRDLERELERVNRRHADKQSDHNRVTRQLKFLDSTVEFAKVQLPTEMKTQFPSPQQLTAMLGFLDEHYRELGNQHTNIKRLLDELGREREIVERRLQRLRKGTREYRRSIDVLFRAEEAQDEVRIEVDYRVSGAAWEPVYKVDISEALDSIAFNLMAQVSQQTGENWTDVALTLSSAEPPRGGELPQPRIWRLEPPRPPRPRVHAQARSAARIDVVDMMADDVALSAAAGGAVTEELPPEPAPGVTSERRESALSVEYAPQATYDIAHGVESNLIPVAAQSTSGEFFHHAVPGVDNCAHLVCRMSADVDLLPGRLNVHMGGQLVAVTQLEAATAGDPFDVNLGRDRQVILLREKLSDHRNETLLGVIDRASVAREFRYRVRIENRKSTPVQLQLYDAAPISTSDRIEVKGAEWTPPPTDADWQGRRGIYRWEFALQPGAVEETELAFQVRYPRDIVPVGL